MNKFLPEALNRFFSSLKIAIFLLFILCVISVFGTLVPQQRSHSEYVHRFPNSWKLILNLGINDVYNNPAFIFTLALLSISTVVCTVNRLKLVIRKMSKRLETASVKEVRSLAVTRELESAICEVPQNFKKYETGDGHLVHLRTSGRWALIGGLTIHLGFLIILIGGLWGFYVRAELSLNGTEGDLLSVPHVEAVRAGAKADSLRHELEFLIAQNVNHPAIKDYNSRIALLDSQYKEGRNSPLFQIGIKKLWVDYYDQNAGVKDWNSEIELTIPGSNVPPQTHVVRVNQPVSFKGFTIYQSNWSRSYQTVHFTVRSPDADDHEHVTHSCENGCSTDTQQITMKIGEPVKPEWSEDTFMLVEFFPDFRMMGAGKFTSASDNLANPAGRIVVLDDQGNVKGRVWAFGPKLAAMADHFSDYPMIFGFASADEAYRTGLQLTYDPGVPVVWVGCFLMVVGLLLSFYLPYTEEWLVIAPDGQATAAVSGNRPTFILQNWLAELISEIDTNKPTGRDDNER